MTSPVYWHPFIYRNIMKVLYGKHFEERYRVIADLVPEGSSVVEVCAGDAYLYQNYLKKKDIVYTGLDVNPVFVNSALKNRIHFLQFDLSEDPLPEADIVLIQASLYQFIPDQELVVHKLLKAARKVLIVAEPVKNLSSSKNPLIRLFARYSANPGSSHAPERFDESSLVPLFQKFPEFNRSFLIPGGRELVGIFKKG